MKSLKKIIAIYAVFILFFLVDSVLNKSTKRSSAKNNLQKDEPQKEEDLNYYRTRKGKVKLNYDTLDEIYKAEALKPLSIKQREKQLDEHTIKKVFKLFEVEEKDTTDCLANLNEKQRRLIMNIFVQRSNLNNADTKYINGFKEIPKTCTGPLAKMKSNLALYMNKYLDLIREFAYKERKLKKLREKRYA